MEREIVLSSYSVKGKGNNKPEDFTIKFDRPLILDSNIGYGIGLNRIVNMSFTWFNVNPKYNNQLIKYSSTDGVSWKNISLPAGVWDYVDFNKYIRRETRTGDSDNYVYPINLYFDTTTFRVTITLAENYRLDLTASNFHDLVGFKKEILTQRTNVGSYVPNLAQDTELLNIHCDLLNSSLVDGVDTDIIYSFSTSVLVSSESFEREPLRVTYSPVNKTTISSIRIYITDGKRRIIDLNGADTSFSLILKEME